MPKGHPEGTRHGHFGEQSANSIWTDQQARMIREWHAGGFSYHDLHLLWGGCKSALSDLCCGKTYQTAGGPIAGVDYPKGRHLKPIIILGEGKVNEREKR